MLLITIVGGMATQTIVKVIYADHSDWSISTLAQAEAVRTK